MADSAQLRWLVNGCWAEVEGGHNGKLEKRGSNNGGGWDADARDGVGDLQRRRPTDIRRFPRSSAPRADARRVARNSTTHSLTLILTIFPFPLLRAII